MKHSLCILAVFMLLTAAVPAADNPVDKGSIIIGGSAYFMSQSGDAYRDTRTVTITPAVGFFASPGIFLGAQVDYSYWDSGRYSQNVYCLGPVIGYYLNTSQGRSEAKGAIYPYFIVFAGYGGIDTDATMYQFGGQIGATLMLSNSIGLQMTVRASLDTIDPDHASSIRGGTILAGFGLTSFIY